MSINKEWHQKNKIPQKLIDKVKWHIKHKEVCGCREMPKYVIEYLKNNKVN